jgi:hypothetical protein
MNEIKKGDLVCYTVDLEELENHARTWEVEYVAHEEAKAWIHCTLPNGNRIDRISPTCRLTRVAPRFEPGKKYTRIGAAPDRSESVYPVTVVDVTDDWAIGWRRSGAPWTCLQDRRGEWAEVQ